MNCKYCDKPVQIEHDAQICLDCLIEKATPEQMDRVANMVMEWVKKQEDAMK